MSSLALAVLALVCSIFGTTSEPTHHGRNTVFGDLSTPNMRKTNPILTLHAENHRQPSEMRHYNTNTRSKRETNDDPRCESFTFKPGTKWLTHPKDPEDLSKLGESKYTKNTTCFTTIETPESNQVITLTFIDVFEIEGHPECKNDFLEIRDGRFGYATPVYKFCGKSFPPTITSTGPFLWLKFKSDDSIEYSGFSVDIDFPTKATSTWANILSYVRRLSGCSPPQVAFLNRCSCNFVSSSQSLVKAALTSLCELRDIILKIYAERIHESCYRTVTHRTSGVIDSSSEDVKPCVDQTSGPLDIQWRIETQSGTQISLIVTKFQLATPNNCSTNSVQVFGAEPNFDHKLGFFCSSVAQSLITVPDSKGIGPGNIMYVRMFTERRSSNFSAKFTEFRTAEKCDEEKEFDCLDGTCIDSSLKCDTQTWNCRLNSDEDPTVCKDDGQSLVTDNRTILIIFSLTLSGILAVLLFKCVRKVYQDRKQINAQRANFASLLDFDKTTSQHTLNRKPARDFGPLSLEYENQANEMCRQNIQRESSSLDSNLLQPVDPNDDWPESFPILPEDIRVEHNGRPGRDLTQREALRAKSTEESEGATSTAPDLKEMECQTRESLFLMEPFPRPGTKSGSNSRGVSGAASPPAAEARPPAPEPRLTLPRQPTAQDAAPQTERPMSSENRRSAPDVIIVSPR